MKNTETEKIYLKKSRKTEFHSDESWAVSYSDLLMVLMSFFIVFFKINDEESVRQESFNNVLLKLEKVATVKKVTKVEDKLDRNSETAKKSNRTIVNIELGKNTSNTRELASFSKKLKADNVSESFKGNKNEATVGNEKLEINIDLANNLYGLGMYDVNSEVQKQLDKIINIVKNDISGLQLIIIGHTDKLRFNKASKGVINNNLILSSLRAAKAVEYLVGQGLPEEKVFVQGLNGQPRDTRSLTVRLREL